MGATCNRHDRFCAVRGGGRVGIRWGLYAGVSVIALVAFGEPGVAEAACSGADQTISSVTPGPILSTGGKIDVETGGSIAGGPTGILASACSISTLTNQGSV